ncbi:MAG: DUF3365 domain-containing protein [Gammaproteobacteria bacterium]|nr:DUF3365 domain-containing protein [Gammaproteobacteria bacterium]
MFGRLSITVKHGLVVFVTILLIILAIITSLRSLKVQVLRNEAQAVASQVVSFRSWVAGSGMIWVNSLSKDFHDFLAKRPDGDGNFFFGKNPALATRELSTIANKSSIRATFRVTSDEYRQPLNAPDSFESAAITAIKADKEKEFVEGIEEGSYRYIQPIFVKQACLKCHGDPKDAPKAVIEKYGDKKAFGYKVGDVRGVISVTLPDLTLGEVMPTLANPYTLGLLIAAILLNFIFTEFILIRRLRQLTERAEAIARGEFDTDLEFADPTKSRDEVDHVYNAVNLLRNSLRIAMRRLRKR